MREEPQPRGKRSTVFSHEHSSLHAGMHVLERNACCDTAQHAGLVLTCDPKAYSEAARLGQRQPPQAVALGGSGGRLSARSVDTLQALRSELAPPGPPTATPSRSSSCSSTQTSIREHHGRRGFRCAARPFRSPQRPGTTPVACGARICRAATVWMATPTSSPRGRRRGRDRPSRPPSTRFPRCDSPQRVLGAAPRRDAPDPLI